MGIISKIVKAGLKKLKGKKPVVTFDAHEGLYRVPVKGGKPYFTPDIEKADAKALELYGNDGFTGYVSKVGEAKASTTPRSTFGGKKKRMATKKDYSPMSSPEARQRSATRKARVDANVDKAKGKGAVEVDARIKEAAQYGKIGTPDARAKSTKSEAVKKDYGNQELLKAGRKGKK